MVTIRHALVLLFALQCAGELLESDECLESDVQMLQLGTSMSDSHSKIQSAKSLKNCGHIIGNQQECDPSANFLCSNNCKIHTHGDDCYRPVPEVMAEHPGEDGYCPWAKRLKNTKLTEQVIKCTYITNVSTGSVSLVGKVKVSSEPSTAYLPLPTAN